MQKNLVVQANVRRNNAIDGSELQSFEQWQAKKVVDQLVSLKTTPDAADMRRMQIDVFRDGLGIEAQADEKYFSQTWLKNSDAGAEMDLIKAATIRFNALLANDPLAIALISEALTDANNPDSVIKKCLILAIVRTAGVADRVLVGLSGHLENDPNHPNVKFHTALVDMIERAQNTEFVVCEYANLGIKDAIWEYQQKLHNGANNNNNNNNPPNIDQGNYTKNCAEFQIVNRLFKETIAKQQPVTVVSAVNLMMRLSEKMKPDITNVPSVTVPNRNSFIKMSLAKCCTECQRIKGPMMDFLAFGRFIAANPNSDIPVSPISSPRFFRHQVPSDRKVVIAVNEYCGKQGSLWEKKSVVVGI